MQYMNLVRVMTFSCDFNFCSVPESKQHMVLPEIEEEEEEQSESHRQSRLSLTSLLLGKDGCCRT